MSTQNVSAVSRAHWVSSWARWGGGLLLALAPLAHAADSAYGRVIVKLKPDAGVLRNSVVQVQSVGPSGQALQPMQKLGQRRGLVLQDGRELGPHVHVAMASGMSSEALAAVLAKDNDVVYAVPDRLRKLHSVYPNDPLFSDAGNPNVAAGQWFLRTPGIDAPAAAINAQAAWNTVRGTGVTVAEVDTGVRTDHLDLVNKLRPGVNMISYKSVSGLQVAGRTTDPSDLGDWVDQAGISAISAEVGVTVDCQVQASSDWHGTKVAGIIGAEANNGVGGASVAPGAMILPVRALGKCGGWDSDIIAGMRWASGQAVGSLAAPPRPARVINMSLGGAGACSQAYKDAIADITSRNVVIVASAGNDNGLAVSTPANCPGVITVAGLRHVGTKVGYSSLGPEVSLSAPAGNCVNSETGPCLYTMLTTSNSGTTTPDANANGGTVGSIYTDQASRWANGTSFAAPQVSGAAALLLEARSSLTPAAVSSLLRRHARTFPSSGDANASGNCVAPSAAEQLVCYCTTQTCGAGMLDVDAAVQAALTDPVAVITVNPSTQASPQANQPIYLSALQSMVSPLGSSMASYAWQLLDGGGIVNANGWSSSSAQTQLTPTGPGAFKVRLQVQDDTGRSASIDQWVYVAGSSPPPQTNTSSTGGGGGGGSMDAFALTGLCLLILLVMSVQQVASSFREVASIRRTPRS